MQDVLNRASRPWRVRGPNPKSPPLNLLLAPSLQETIEPGLSNDREAPEAILCSLLEPDLERTCSLPDEADEPLSFFR